MLLSIIVPIYNKSQYLESCFASLMQQGLRNDEFEIILINDGSIDDSERLCNDFIITHNNTNIRYYYQKNSGVSCARNKGIELAQGKYIHFMDCDDTLKRDSYRYIIDNICQDSYDYIGFGMCLLDLRTTEDIRIPDTPLTDGKIVQHTRGLESIIAVNWPSTCCLGLYRTEFLKKHGIRFPKGITIGEDVWFNFEFFSKNPSVCYTSCCPYIYWQRKESAMTTISKERAEKWFYSYHALLAHLVSASNRNTTIQAGIRHVINHHVSVFLPKVLQFGIPKRQFKYWADKFSADMIIPTNESSIYCRLADFLFLKPSYYPYISWLYNHLIYKIIVLIRKTSTPPHLLTRVNVNYILAYYLNTNEESRNTNLSWCA